MQTHQPNSFSLTSQIAHNHNQEVDSHILDLVNDNTHNNIDIKNINSNISTLNSKFDSFDEVKNNLTTSSEEMKNWMSQF
jgi:hypothetical protein